MKKNNDLRNSPASFCRWTADCIHFEPSGHSVGLKFHCHRLQSVQQLALKAETAAIALLRSLKTTNAEIAKKLVFANKWICHAPVPVPILPFFFCSAFI
eukprot:759394-Hanusia_phi.AAC.5